MRLRKISKADWRARKALKLIVKIRNLTTKKTLDNRIRRYLSVGLSVLPKEEEN